MLHSLLESGNHYETVALPFLKLISFKQTSLQFVTDSPLIFLRCAVGIGILLFALVAVKYTSPKLICAWFGLRDEEEMQNHTRVMIYKALVSYFLLSLISMFYIPVFFHYFGFGENFTRFS